MFELKFSPDMVFIRGSSVSLKSSLKMFFLKMSLYFINDIHSNEYKLAEFSTNFDLIKSSLSLIVIMNRVIFSSFKRLR